MTDVFIAYAREDGERVRAIAEALQMEGWDVWWDPTDPSPLEGDVVDTKLNSAGAVLVVWSTYARASEHVRAEAAAGLYRNKLVQARIDYAPPPRPFDQVEAVDLSLWPGDRDDMMWRSVASMVQRHAGAPGSLRAKPQRKIFSKPAYIEKRTLRPAPFIALALVIMLGAGAWFVDPFNWRGLRPPGETVQTRAADEPAPAGGLLAVAEEPVLESTPEADAAWARVNRDDPVALRAFLSVHPRGPHAETARSLIRVMDAQAWVDAVTRDTEAAYRAYIAAFPADGAAPGAMAAAAADRLAELTLERAQAIAQIQRGLAAMNLYSGDADGVAGQGTARAARTFAASARLTAPDLATAAPRDLRSFGDRIAAAAGGGQAQAARADTAAIEAADRQRVQQAQAAAAAAAAVQAPPPVAADPDADTLAQGQLTQADAAAWAAAQGAGTLASYRAYLDSFPAGANANEARAEIARLSRPPPFSTAQLAAPVRSAVEAARAAQSTAAQRAAAARTVAAQADEAAASARAAAPGTAVIVAPDGDRYETQVAGNSPNGLGVRVSGKAASVGDRYRGELRNGLGQGLGVYEYGDNPNNAAAGALRYEGEHAGDASTGHGVIFWRNGDTFAGVDAGGGASRGVLTFANGARYEGELRDGARHGPGVMWSAAGEPQLAGRWDNGALVEAMSADTP